MTIPLDNLYHYIEGLFSEPVCVYLFHPHGSRNISNLIGLRPINRIEQNLDGVVLPQVVCNDQEPLNYDLYQNLHQTDTNFFGWKKHPCLSNIKSNISINIHDDVILMHSEKNSLDLELYEKNNYVGVHYWCHAFIARDWYRFAEHDKRLNLQCYPEKDFLVYCRDCTGSREYRIKFQELLSDSDLTKDSQTSIKKINGNYSIEDFTFNNKQLAPSKTDFLHKLDDNSFEASCSADYNVDDFVHTKISVVLETVFDGPKIHLTEKIFRPIACGHPFILAAGPGSLDYIKSYGFKTFSPWIDESYDEETDSVSRLHKIVNAMQQFSNLSTTEKKTVYLQLKKIAAYNKQWFFSKEFTTIINNELVNNINHAVEKVKKTRFKLFRSRIKNYDNKQQKKEKRTIVANYIKRLKKFNPPGK